MGNYFNPGNESFTKYTKSRIYIDKTGMLNELNQVLSTSENCIAVSHARRFGKSQAAGMIDAYYSIGSDSKELFSKYEISKSEDYIQFMNQYNVIHMDISSLADSNSEGIVEEIKKRLVKEFNEELPFTIDEEDALNCIIYTIYEKTKRKFVIILDEWDCIIRNYSDSPKLIHDYMKFLHSIFKSEESNKYLALAYITGILPIKKMEDESALNNFREFTMVKSKPFTQYFGFTEEEVKSLCEQYHMDFETVKEWYDGYYLDGLHMYNPNSVYQAMIQQELDSYWKNTSAFKTINAFITMNYEGLKDDVVRMLAGEKVRVNTDTFQNDLISIGSKEEALTALIHLGYLGYDYQNKKAYIPNFEVAKAYEAAIKSGQWTEIGKLISKCDDLLEATIQKDAKKVGENVELAHEVYASHLEYNDENSLSCVLTMAYFTAPAYYNIVREFPTGKGYADLMFLPRKGAGDRPAILVELKYDKSADTAIQQIKDKRYEGQLKKYYGNLLLVGINYNSKDRKHECIIEEV